MRLSIRELLLFMTLCFSARVIAQEAQPLTEVERDDVCVALAGKFAVNASKSFQKEVTDVLAISNICKEEWSKADSSTKVGIKAWYSALTGILDASDDKITQAQSRYCEGHYGSWWSEKIKSTEAQTVSSDGADVVKTCLLMTKASLLPTLMVANDGKEFSMSIQYRPDQPTETVMKLFGPMDLVRNVCKGTKANKTIVLKDSKDIVQALRPSESVTVSCTRSAFPIKREGVDYSCTDEAIFNVSTSGVVAPTKIPRICVPSFQESHYQKLVKRIEPIENELNNIKNNYATKTDMELMLKTLRDGLANKVDGRSFKLHPKGTTKLGGGVLCLSVYDDGPPGDDQRYKTRSVVCDSANEWTTVLP